MAILSRRNIKKDLEKVRKYKSIVEKNLALGQSDESKIHSLTFDELNDLDQILQIADFMLCKYENQKEMLSLMKDFVKMIQYSANSSGILKDKIDELSFSAEISVKTIKSLQSDMSENTPFLKQNMENLGMIKQKNSGNNLTNSSTPVYIEEYLSKSKEETTR